MDTPKTTDSDVNVVKLNSTIEEAARAAHEANRNYCESIGDQSQPPWTGAPDWQKDSARAGVRALIYDPSKTPEQMHEGWMSLKLEQGWVYGEVKDVEKKEHPCLVGYELLPEAQRRKDEIFRETVLRVLEASAPSWWGMRG